MTRQDFEELQRLVPHLSGFRRVGVLSPIREGEKKLFPKATALPIWRWNLNKPSDQHFDLLIASNVFMYSSDPARWFRHVLGSCKYFLFLDLIRRRRSRDSELHRENKDVMRFAIGQARPRVERFFDLGSLGDRLLGYHTFHGGASEFDDDPLHVLALFRGDLADPVIRVDDYPTGVRPILSDLSPLHDILRKIETRELRYYLGIVPALLTEEMCDFLNSLKSMIPAAHGFDHCYPKYAPFLMSKGDPFNQRGIAATFNEFKGRPYEVIVSRLSEGRRLLRECLGRPMDSYIPPCNRADLRTGRALVEAGYTVYLSDRRIPGCSLPRIRSDFSGRSDKYDYDRRPDVITLHVTWECDLARQGAGNHLDRLLDHLAERRKVERERGMRLGAVVNGAL